MKFDYSLYMKPKNIHIILMLFIVLLLGCKSTRSIDFQSEIPFQIESPYYQPWNSGVQDGGSGIDVILPIKNLNAIVPDSIHFQGQRTKAVVQQNIIVGHINTINSKRQDIILSNEPLAELNNQLLPLNDSSPFEIENNACILSYLMKGKRYYFKIENLERRLTISYPLFPSPQ